MIIAIPNNINRFDLYLLSKNIIAREPYPYIGHIGPIKNPLFINLFFSISLHITSINHPENEYIINNKNIA